MITLIHLPRTDGTFLSNLAKDISGFYVYGHKPTSSLKRKSYITGMIRNPFDWYVSRFEYFRNSRPDDIIEI